MSSSRGPASVLSRYIAIGVLAWTLLACGPIAKAAAPATAPAEPATDTQRLSWDRVCHVDVLNDNLLVIKTQLTDEDLERIDTYGSDEEIDGLEGTTSLSISRSRFSLRNTQVSGDRRATATVYISSWHLSLQLSVSNGGRSRTVELQQAGWSPRRRSMDPGEVRLSAYGDDVPGGHVNLSYPNFGMLLHGRPHEMNRYVRPLLRHLKVDMIGPTEEEVRQVLKLPPTTQDAPPAGAKEQAALAANVKQLVVHLGDPTRADRNAATQKLIGLGPAAMAPLHRLDRTTLSPDQNLGVDLLLSDEHAVTCPVLAERAERLRYDVNFLLNCLYSEDELSRAAAVEQLAHVTGKIVPENSPLFDPMSDWEGRASVIEKLRDDLVPKDPE